MQVRPPKQTALLLLQTYASNYPSDYWQRHDFAVPVVCEGVRYCVCEICFGGMLSIAEQWQADHDSMMNDLRESGRRFLGFYVDEELERKLN